MFLASPLLHVQGMLNLEPRRPACLTEKKKGSGTIQNSNLNIDPRGLTMGVAGTFEATLLRHELALKGELERSGKCLRSDLTELAHLVLVPLIRASSG